MQPSMRLKKLSSTHVPPLAVLALLTLNSPAFAQSPQTPQQPQPIPLNEKQEKNPPTITLPATLTLPQAIELALLYQPNVAGAVANRERVQQNEAGAKSRYFPTVTPQYTYLNQYTFGTVNQFVGSGVVIPVQQGTTRETKQAQIGASLRVIDAGTREYTVRQARQNVRAQEYGEENTRQTVVVNVADTYFNVLRNDALVRVSASQVDRAKNTLDVITAQVAAGVAAPKDILQARADYLNAQVNLLTAQNNAAVAQANLKSAVGLVGGEPLKLADVPVPGDNTPVTATVPNLSATAFNIPDGTNDTQALQLLTDAAFKARPDISQLEQTVEVSKTSVKLSQINAGVSFTTDVTVAEQINPNQFNGSIGRNRQVSVGVSYPLFDGGLVRSQVRANQAGVRSSEAQLASLKQQVAVEVEQAYRTLVQTRAALPAAAAAVEAARTNYQAAEASRREGVSSVVEVITAQTSLVQAETNYVQAIYNFYAADARLARAVGQADRIPLVGATTPGAPAPVTPTPPPPAGTPAPQANPAAN